MTEEVGMAISAELATAESIEQLASMLVKGAYEYAKAMGHIDEENPYAQMLRNLREEFPEDSSASL